MAAQLTQMPRSSLTKTDKDGCACTLYFRASERWSNGVDQAGSSGLPVMSLAGRGVRERTGHKSRPKAGHCQLILICEKCGRRSGAKTSIGYCLQTRGRLCQPPGASKSHQRSPPGKISSCTFWRSETAVTRV